MILTIFLQLLYRFIFQYNSEGYDLKGIEIDCLDHGLDGTQDQSMFILDRVFRNGLGDSSRLQCHRVIPEGEIRLWDRIKSMSVMESKDTGFSDGFDEEKSRVHVARYSESSALGRGGPLPPLISDMGTVITLARMCANVYESRNDSQNWYNTDPFIIENDYGWEDDGLRGYLYTNCDRSILILAIKGTSTSLFSENGTTTVRDRFMDNVMFSCCCAMVDFTWTPICSCYNESNRCFHDCVCKSIVQQSDSYFSAAFEIYRKIRLEYPKSTIWITGHSLGGALASLVTLASVKQHDATIDTYRPPVFAIAFESPGERLYAQRMGLFPYPWPNGTSSLIDHMLSEYPIYHIYHTADPIPYGACVGKFSSCYYGGYALETTCHIGNIYELDLGYERFDINKHRLRYLVENILSAWDIMPTPSPQAKCIDCSYWEFICHANSGSFCFS
jgi:lipase ATG15